MRRGCLIVLEGIDRVGKSTQARLLVDRLRSDGMKVEMMNFPDRTTQIGNTINSYLTSEDSRLDDHAVHLLFSANRWEKMGEMEIALREGRHLVIDRYAFSGVAFTGAKPGFSLDWCKRSDSGIIKPDCVFFLQMDPESAKARCDYGNERYEKLDFQKKVLANYLSLQDDCWRTIRADQNIDAVHGEMYHSVCDVIEKCSESPITRLWV